MRDDGPPTYTFDFTPGLRTPRGRAVCRAHIATGGTGTPRPFGYRFDDVFLARPTGARLPASLADALDIAVAVYVADRAAPRSGAGSEQWYRHLLVRIPVRQASLRGSSDLRARLEQFLTQLTDDRWSIEFTTRTAPPRPSERQAPLFSEASQVAPVTVLHSGGLDSCIGVIEAAQTHPGGVVQAVSVVSHSHPSLIQRQVLAMLRPSLPATVTWAPLVVGLAGVARADQESSQRARGFLYLTVGTVAAALGGSSGLQLCENGLGAINLPCAPDQLGAMTTRAMHPLTLARFASLIGELLGRPLAVRNTGLWHTKAELCRTWLTSDDRITAARQTISCDRFPRMGVHRTCGRCTSCLVRQAAWHAAGLPWGDGIGIPHADFDPLSPATSWADHDLLPIYALRSQAARLKCAVRTPASLVETFPQLTRLWQASPYLGIPPAAITERLLDLFRSYVGEWELFAVDVAWPAITEAPALASIDPSVVAAIAS